MVGWVIWKCVFRLVHDFLPFSVDTDVDVHLRPVERYAVSCKPGKVHEYCSTVSCSGHAEGEYLRLLLGNVQFEPHLACSKCENRAYHVYCLFHVLQNLSV